MFFLGLDLSGPTNTADTALACFELVDGRLQLAGVDQHVTDDQIYRWAGEKRQAGPLVVGLDAPLSYQPGGGDRPGDRRLRRRLIQAGLPPGSVMTPTMTRMVYLTLRGVALAHTLQSPQAPRVDVVEIHPAAVLALRGAPVESIVYLKKSQEARDALFDWMENNGLNGAVTLKGSGDHLAAACAAALGAWHWWAGRPAWLEPASPPAHPFDFAA